MKKVFLSLLCLAGLVVNAQEEESKLTISGSVDAYYQTYLNTNDKGIPSFNDDGTQIFDDNGDAVIVPQAFGSSFADETGFALGMANVIFAYEGEKTGVVADLVFGPRGDAAAGGFNLNQLYAYWNVSESTTLTMGRFNTYLGYEVISPVGNFNYSTSYLFSNGPFSHVGLKADFSLSDDFSLMLAVMNPTDTNNNLTGDLGLGAQLGYAGQYLNLYYDSGVVLGFEIDYTGGFDLSEAFFLGINAAYQDNDGSGFYGAALYPQLATSDDFSVGLRGEIFAMHGDANPAEESVLGLTLTGSYTIENLIIKPEIRLDGWNDATPYFDNDGVANNSLAAFTVAAIYSF